MKPTGTVYLLHFSQAYKPARHYVGFTTNLDERLKSTAEGQALASLKSSRNQESAFAWSAHGSVVARQNAG
jgi:hypothetical protein